METIFRKQIEPYWRSYGIRLPWIPETWAGLTRSYSYGKLYFWVSRAVPTPTWSDRFELVFSKALWKFNR
jgi:hypothetical protein